MPVKSVKSVKGEKLLSPLKARQFFEERVSFMMDPCDLLMKIEEGKAPNIIDIREPDSFNEEHIPGAVNLPEDDWQSARGLDKKKLNVIYSYASNCTDADRAAAFFAKKGYPVMVMEPGIEGWKEYDYDTEKGASEVRRKRAA